MKILMLTPVFDMGGTEIYILNIIKYLKANDIEVKLITGNGIRKNRLEEENIEYSIINSLSKKGIVTLMESVKKLRKEIKIFKPNIIHTSSFFTTIVAKLTVMSLKGSDIKIINTLHGGPNRNIEKQSSKVFNICSDMIIALSERTKKDLIKNGLKEEKISVVYNGVDVNFKNKKSTIERKDGKINILTCGRLTEQKGHTYLIKAVNELRKIREDFVVEILGDGDLRESLENEIKTLGVEDYVKLIGFKDDVYNFINNCDIFILPSLWEQFPITTLEAMYFSKPIIASDVNGVREQLDDSGILIEAGNVSDIVKSLDELIDDSEKRKDLGIKAKKRFEENFTLENMGRDTVAVYKDVLNN